MYHGKSNGLVLFWFWGIFGGISLILAVRSNNLDLFIEISSFAIEYYLSLDHNVNCKITTIDQTVDLGVDYIPIGKKT